MKFVDKVLLAYLLTNAISVCFAQNCKTDCSSTCSPSCSGNNVCAVGTMTTCGVCPVPKCVPRSTIGLPDIEDTTDSGSSSNAGLIGGLVGGILGAGLIVGVLIFLMIRRRIKKKNTIPLAFRSKQRNNNSNNTTASVNEEMQEPASRQVLSGVIPVTFIPPTASSHNSMYTESEAETPRSRYGSFATFANQNEDDLENPFSDRPISNAHSIMTTTTTATDYHSRRDSTESNVSRQHVATVVQATQVMRAKPQIMRVNTVKVQDGVTRSGSFKKTIQPDNTSSSASTPITPHSRAITPLPATSPAVQATSITITEEDDPFDDKNKVTSAASPTTSYTNSIVGSRNNKPTDSVMSAPGDGEITIFWNGS
ncbi:hypothetical protein V8B55DRAFT_1503560 [Mucor lusitanicus]|uniref:Membrane anchor Opy2 N-terminal domain-containing protein n=1 Tax=Mucor circinelloides f. lusitanicus TaxID=29924 RepID=A0A8H4BKW4_MUCCL|nr:hypothetical protein FB192DRAFT_1367067 [Mucor lusitanicus]